MKTYIKNKIVPADKMKKAILVKMGYYAEMFYLNTERATGSEWTKDISKAQIFASVFEAQREAKRYYRKQGVTVMLCPPGLKQFVPRRKMGWEDFTAEYAGWR
jgi:hypothetical protein